MFSDRIEEDVHVHHNYLSGITSSGNVKAIGFGDNGELDMLNVGTNRDDSAALAALDLNNGSSAVSVPKRYQGYTPGVALAEYGLVGYFAKSAYDYVSSLTFPKVKGNAVAIVQGYSRADGVDYLAPGVDPFSGLFKAVRKRWSKPNGGSSDPKKDKARGKFIKDAVKYSLEGKGEKVSESLFDYLSSNSDSFIDLFKGPAGLIAFSAVFSLARGVSPKKVVDGILYFALDYQLDISPFLPDVWKKNQAFLDFRNREKSQRRLTSNEVGELVLTDKEFEKALLNEFWIAAVTTAGAQGAKMWLTKKLYGAARDSVVRFFEWL